MKAAIYSRFSTDKQTESSIADQVRVCTEYSEKQGWTITHRFEDQGISGAAIGNRPGCVAMLEAAKQRAFDVLLVMDTSRLSRSSADLSKIADRLVFMGLRILAVQESGADTAKDGWELYFGLSGLMGQQFRKMTSKKTHTALESRARVGRSTGGRCFGYTSKNELVEAEAPIVREIFERRAAGESLRAIVKDLNARGVPSPRGRPWYVSALHALLGSERYLGRITWNRTAWRKDPDTGKRIRVERDESEHVTAVREDLRLVSDETWQRVRVRDTPATYGSHQARPKYPLSGLLLCAECGRAMTLCGGTNSRGYGSQRYVCPSYREHLGCSNGMGVSRAVVEELLIDPLRDRLLGDQKFLNAVTVLRKQQWDLTISIVPQNDQNSTYEVGRAPPIDFGRSISGPVQNAALQAEGRVMSQEGDPPDDAPLAAKIAAIESAAAVGALSQREARARCDALRAEHEIVTRSHGPIDQATLVANLKRLREALDSAAIDALRTALRRVLGTVRLQPTVEGDSRYLVARFEGGDLPLLEWLTAGSAANEPGMAGLSALVAGAGFEPATFGL